MYCTVLYYKKLENLQRTDKQTIREQTLREFKNKWEPTFTGPLQVWPMVYILYIGINLGIIMKQYGDRKNSSDL